MDAAELAIFHHLFASVAEEMGVTLGRTGYSPNIKERRDYSCAIFDPDGRMVAQAAHETGWGRKEIRHADGSPSFNLFGIKAGANWNGPTAEITTTEFLGGVARKVTAKFRAYGSYDESFADYARMMKTSGFQAILPTGSPLGLSTKQ